ncbi:MAG TPA: thioredoxin, partial [Lactobacillus acetotolerans]|nr:thioredoxin [Lactobacillus acetotolerans]
GPCKMLAPVIEEVKAETSDFLKVVKINVDDNPELASQYGVRSIPTLVFVKNGQVANQAVGFRSKKDILKMVQ